MKGLLEDYRECTPRQPYRAVLYRLTGFVSMAMVDKKYFPRTDIHSHFGSPFGYSRQGGCGRKKAVLTDPPWLPTLEAAVASASTAAVAAASFLRALVLAYAKFAARAPDLAEYEVRDGDVGAVGIQREACGGFEHASSIMLRTC